MSQASTSSASPSSKPLLPVTTATAWVALATAVGTWVLLMVGAMVHGTGSSLACPDWPTCYGTFFPEMKNGVLYEHGHRVVATLVGLLTMLLAGLLWAQRRQSPAHRRYNQLGLLAFLLVVAQGVLGGITVTFDLPILVTLAHLATSVAFFSLVLWLSLRTQPLPALAAPGANRVKLAAFRPWLVAGWLVTMGQIVLGGIVRHTHNGLACLNPFLCDGALWPSHFGPQLQMSHRLVAVALATYVLAMAFRLRKTSPGAVTHAMAASAVLIVTVQLTLGIFAVWRLLPAWIITLHMGGAGLLLSWHLLLLAMLPNAAAERDERVLVEGAVAAP